MSEVNIERAFPGWKIDGILGSGPFGTVYLTHTMVNSSPAYAAVKVIRMPPAEQDVLSAVNKGVSGDMLRTYFGKSKNELNWDLTMFRSVSSQHLVNVDAIAMEDLPGAGWEGYIRSAVYTPMDVYFETSPGNQEEAARLGDELCQALEALEGSGMVHGDIRPENVMVSDDGSFSLSDYGVKKCLEKAGTGLFRLTGEEYEAPELSGEEKNYTARTDIYALGMLMCYTANGCALPPGNSPDSIPDMDPDLARVIRHATAENPEDRYMSASEMRLDILRLGIYSRKHPVRKTVTAAAAFEIVRKNGGTIRAETAGDDEFEKAVRDSRGEDSPQGGTKSPSGAEKAGGAPSGGLKKGGNRKLLIILAAVVVIAVIVIIILLTRRGGDTTSDEEPEPIPAEDTEVVELPEQDDDGRYIIDLTPSDDGDEDSDESEPSESGDGSGDEELPSGGSYLGDEDSPDETEDVIDGGQTSESGSNSGSQTQQGGSAGTSGAGSSSSSGASSSGSSQSSKTSLWVFENSDTVLITRADLEGMDRNTSYTAINEIYARHGKIFTDSSVQSYFEGQSWYTPVSTSSDAAVALMNSVEKANIRTLVDYQREMGYRSASSSSSSSQSSSASSGSDTSDAAASQGSSSDADWEYVLPTDTVLITREDLEGMDRETSYRAINEIYARHGKIFTDQSIQAYFEAQPWYTPVTTDSSQIVVLFSDLEYTNLHTLTAYQREMGYRS